MTHEIYKSFHDGLEVRGVLFDISKPFDKVWHEGLILRLSLNGISGNLFKLLRDCQRRGSARLYFILGPLLFLIYVNDLSNGVSSNCKLFADDTSFFSC